MLFSGIQRRRVPAGAIFEALGLPSGDLQKCFEDCRGLTPARLEDNSECSYEILQAVGYRRRRRGLPDLATRITRVNASGW